MPKLYEYLGLVVFFYANEHEPVHVHARSQGRESRAELVLVNGRVVDVRFGSVAGHEPLSRLEGRRFEELVHAKADDIVARWIDFFVLNKSVTPEIISRRLT